MAVSVELKVNDSIEATARYLTWTPLACELRVVDPALSADPVTITVSTAGRSRTAGRLAFRETAKGPATDTLKLTLTGARHTARFFVSGAFGSASRADGDAVLLVRKGTTELSRIPLMVRVRKDAEELTPAERDRFLGAFAKLNNQGQGLFSSFRAAHTDDTSGEAHFDAGFWPWHRAYLLDLERELQRIDPSVALPYWRFDKPSPKLFTTAFIGQSDPTGFAKFLPSNPLGTWTTDEQLGISRVPGFDPKVSGARNNVGSVTTEEITVGNSEPYDKVRRTHESNPHGRAHSSFGGVISLIDTAARDPLFFLLHANVDRLWAKWQWFQKRFDAENAATFPFPGSSTTTGATRIGHNAMDTMWPWNGETGDPRPSTAPRKPFPRSDVVQGPDATPDVRAMIDFQGQLDPAKQLGFDYDDVPFEPVSP